MSFEIFNFDPSITAGIRALGYSIPTPIQQKAVPVIMHGHDLIGLAQTGTGKTAAFVLPILQHLLHKPRGQIGALVISPTRELAEQTCSVATQLAQPSGLRSVSIYGGVGMQQQLWELRNGVEIAVACPGRLLDHIWRGSIDLSHVEILVIDEADRMFDMGFLPDIRNILRCLMGERQTLLFSATMPQEIRRLAGEILHNPITVQIGRTAPALNVSHTLYPVKQHLKTALLIQLLRKTETDSVLVFTRTKHRAERVMQQLKRAGFRAASLQGNLSQSRRQEALDSFREGTVKILVATDIAARGIDILHISHVINYDMPESTDAYTHRIGRTGRLDRKGDALTFITDSDTGLVKELEAILKAAIERRMLQGFDYSSPAPDSKHIPDQRRFARSPARPQQKRAKIKSAHFNN